ncbi:MAG: OmpH family outer membrane protein [Paracoccaceae bacterium]
MIWRALAVASVGGALSICGSAGVAQQLEFSTGVPVQDAPEAVRSSIVTLDRTRLFEETRMGRAILSRIDAASKELVAENRRLESALEEEERSLTQRRATLPLEEFRALAAEFDTRVEELRVAQEAKGRALTRAREADQRRFFELTFPVLAELMQEVGAVAIIDRSVLILSFDRIDITSQAIAKLDAELGDGADLAPLPDLENLPDVPPAATPDLQNLLPLQP